MASSCRWCVPLSWLSQLYGTTQPTWRLPPLPLSASISRMRFPSSCASLHLTSRLDRGTWEPGAGRLAGSLRSEEHTSELQSLRHLVCRLLLEKKKEKKYQSHIVYCAL